MKTSYKTIAKPAQAELVVKKSKFIATVEPVTQEEQAIDLINRMRSKYYDASHNVYAYVIGQNNIVRYSDDGEPSGTAGVPVLEVLKKEGIIDAAVVVTRYFGGTLLGAGGLTRAYGSAAKLGVDAGGIVVRVLCDVVSVKTDYTMLGKIKYETNTAGFVIKDIIYKQDVTLLTYCEIECTDQYLALIQNITGGRAVCNIEAREYIDK